MIAIEQNILYSICAVAKQAAILQGEDVIGALMKVGAFRICDVIEAAEEIEEGVRKFETERYIKLHAKKCG